MTLKDCILEIILKIGKGKYFDSHTIINEIIKDKCYHNVYLKEYISDYENCSVSQYHGFIAQKIGEIEGVVPVKDGTCVSHTIYGVLSENQLWRLNI